MDVEKIGKFIASLRKEKNLTQEQLAGFYKCKHCDNKFVPTYLQMWLAPHNGRSRYFKCLKCGKRSFHKKVLF